MKKLIVTAMVLSMVMTMVSCGSEKNDTAKTETEKAAQTTTAQAEDKAEETTAEASPETEPEETKAPEEEAPEMFFEVGYNKASTYPIIYMLPKGNGKQGGEGLVQLQNTGKAQWEEFDAPGTEAKDQKLLKRYNMKFGGIEPDNRKPDMAPADEIKEYLMNGYDQNSLHVNAFGRLMDLIDAKETTVKIDTITSEEKVEVLGSEAYKIKGYFTYDPKRGDETVKCYFSAFFGTFDYEYDPSGNMAGGLPYYMVIAYTSGEFADDEVQQAQCNQLIDTSIKGIYYMDDPNAPEV